MQAIQSANPLVPHPEEERGMFAPKGKLEPRKPEPSPISYEDKLKDICKQIDDECDESAQIRARRYTLNYNYWRGGEARWRYWTPAGWKALDSQVVQQLYSNNQLAGHINTLVSACSRARVKLNVSVSPAAEDDQEKVSAAKVATRTLQHDQRTKLNAEFMQRAWLHKCLYGIEVRGQWYATEGSTSKARAPIIEEQQIPMPGKYVCPTCGMTGPDTEEHEHETEKFPGEVISVPMHTGYEEVPDGDCLTYQISPYEFDLAPEARDIPSSPYARWQREVRNVTLQKAYPKVKIGETPSTLPVMLQAQRALKREKTRKNTTVIKTYWIVPDYYFEFSSQSSMKCLSGYEVPAGTDLGELCPEGLRIDMYNGEILDVRPEVKEDCLSMSPFYLDPLSWDAKGVDDGVALQRWIDNVHTLYLQLQLREALGITLIDKAFSVDGGVFNGEVGTVKTVDVPDGKTINEAMNVWFGQKADGSVFSGMEYVEQSQTNVLGTFPTLSGSTMEGSETARGRIILKEQANQGLGPRLALAAQHDVIWAKQNLKLKKKYWTSERYVPYLDDADPMGGRWFSAADLDADFDIDVEADSWMPVSRLDRIDNLTTALGGEEALVAIGGFAGAASNPNPLIKDIGRKGLELLGAPADSNPEEKDLRVARHRYALIKQAVEMVGAREVPDEMNSPMLANPADAMRIATMPSVQPLPQVDNHPVFIDYYTNLIKDAVDSEGVENDPLTKAVLMILIQAHQQGGVMEMQQNQMMAMQANAPQMLAQQAMQQDQEGKAAEKADTEHQSASHASQLKQDEMRTKGQVDTDSKSLLSQVKV